MIKKSVQNLSLFLATLVVMFIMGEVVFKLMGFPAAIYDYDQITGLGILVPQNKFNYVRDCLKSHVQTNKLGFHDVEHTENKPDDVFRIAVIGDSFVQALEVEYENSFFALLEKRLNTEKLYGKKVEVMAFGRSGNGSTLNYLYLKNFVKKYSPDLVIHTFYPLNDLRDDSLELTKKYVEQTGDKEVYLGKVYPNLMGEGLVDVDQLDHDLQEQRDQRPQRSFLSKLVRSSSLISWVKERFKTAVYNFKQRTEKSSDISSSENQKFPVDHEVFRMIESEEWKKAWETQFALISEITRTIKLMGSKYMLVSIADGFRVEKQYDKFSKLPDEVLNLNAPEEHLKKISESVGVPYLNLYTIFAEEYEKNKDPITYSCDAHWNNLGHKQASDAIFQYLNQNHTK